MLITLEKALAGSRPGGQSGNTTIQSKRVHDRGSQAQREVQNEVSVQTFEACPATYKSGPHVARRNHDHADGEVANRALEPHGVWRGGERSSSARAKTQHVGEHAERENTTWVST